MNILFSALYAESVEINDVSVHKRAKRMLMYCVFHSQLSMGSLSMLPINHVTDMRKWSWLSAQLIGFGLDYSGAVEAFDQLSCDIDPIPITHINLTCYMQIWCGCFSFFYHLLWSANSHLDGFGQIWILSSCSELILLDLRMVLQNLTASDFERAFQSDLRSRAVLGQMWCCAVSELRSLPEAAALESGVHTYQANSLSSSGPG